MLEEDNSESVNLYKELQGIHIEVRKLATNMLSLTSVKEMDLAHFLDRHTEIIQRDISITVRIILEKTYSSREDVLSSLLGRGSISIRAVSPPDDSNKMWVTIRARKPLALIACGNSNQGKTNLARQLSNSFSTVVHGDEVLEKIANRILNASDELFNSSKLGQDNSDWSLSIHSITKKSHLVREFTSMICALAKREDLLFDMYMPAELENSLISALSIQGYLVWSLSKVDPSDVNFSSAFQDFKAIAERDNAIAERDNAIAERDNAIAERDNAIAERDNAIAERDNAIAERDVILISKTWRLFTPYRKFTQFAGLGSGGESLSPKE
jgi:hypothetical protein